jgi:hypothetical protein
MDGGGYFFVVTIVAVLSPAVSLAAQSQRPPDGSAQSEAKAAHSLGRLAESTRVQLASFDPPQAVMSFESSTMA